MSDGRDGYSQIPHKMLETLYRAHLSASAWEVLSVVIRYTLGFRRDRHAMALSFFARATGRHRNTVSRALQELEQRHIIRKCSPATFRLPASWGVRPVEEWLESPQKVRLTVQGGIQPRAVSATLTAKGNTRLTVQGDSDSPPTVIGDPLQEVTKKEKERNSQRKEIEKGSPLLKVPPRGNIVDCAKNAQPTGDISKPSLRSEPTLSEDSVPLPGEGTPLAIQGLQTQTECEAVLTHCWGQAINREQLSRKDQKLIDGILERSPRDRAAVVQEFAAAMAVVRQNPAMLPHRLKGTAEGFIHVLRNRKAIPRSGNQPEPSGKFVDPKPYIDYFTERFGGEAVTLTYEQIREFQNLYHAGNGMPWGTAYCRACDRLADDGGFPGNLTSASDKFMWLARAAQRLGAL